MSHVYSTPSLFKEMNFLRKKSFISHKCSKQNVHSETPISCIGAIFNRMSKVFQNCFGFALPYCVIGPQTLRHSFNQSNIKQKPIPTWSLAFSRVSGRLVGLTLSSHLKGFLLSSDGFLR